MSAAKEGRAVGLDFAGRRADGDDVDILKRYAACRDAGLLAAELPRWEALFLEWGEPYRCLALLLFDDEHARPSDAFVDAFVDAAIADLDEPTWPPMPGHLDITQH